MTKTTLHPTRQGLGSSQRAKVRALEAKLASWWESEEGDWDTLVSETPKGPPAVGAGLFDGMPEVDSKAIARASRFFKEQLGIALDVKLIRPGGYTKIGEAIKDLVPKMVEKAIKLRTF